jgi:excinuclease ABC subunit C
VSACVVFKNGIPSKKEYRHFNVKTVVGPDDFETMKEVVYRRYKRILDEKKKLPDLIVIDGGKGQLHAANEALEQLGLKGKQAIVGIAKRLEELFFPGDKNPLHLDKRSESLKVIQHMRNEAHRFSINHHRNKRSKALIKSEIENIPGIGPKTKALLFQEFKTIESIKKATKIQLSDTIGTKKATIVVDYFAKNQSL